MPSIDIGFLDVPAHTARLRRCRCGKIVARRCRSQLPLLRLDDRPSFEGMTAWSGAGITRGAPQGAGRRMEVFVQQLINGITLGSIYGLIAIGYTMVFGIIGMVNFAHGDVFCVSAFIALIAFLILTSWIGSGLIALTLLIVLIVSMVFTSVVNWAIERF